MMRSAAWQAHYCDALVGERACFWVYDFCVASMSVLKMLALTSLFLATTLAQTEWIVQEKLETVSFRPRTRGFIAFELTRLVRGHSWIALPRSTLRNP